MKLKIHNCENSVYSKASYDAELKNKIIYFKDNSEKDVEYTFNGRIIGKSNKKFNVMFTDLNDEVQDDSGLFFAKINWAQKSKIRWMYGDNFFQSNETIRWVFGIVFGFILGVITGWIKFKC